MSIYERALGNQFRKMHPKLQERYLFEGDRPFRAKGVMDYVYRGSTFLYPLYRLGLKRKLLFPEHGRDIPFTIINTPCKGNDGEQQIHWQREFHFENKKRYFNALMSFDEHSHMIKDYFGEPPIFYSDLSFTVTKAKGLKIESKQQRLVIGRMEIPVPKLFQGVATVIEEFDDVEKNFLIHVKVTNPLVGNLMSYKGRFATDDIS
ncbi:protein of unknown function [Oceanobacillus limi]|uniref:DUF4166 domain-containing protein n=1 Tax=Oceanobacillus limi TaxID=930131 RepID=A0A1I0D642_9BACI|nr:DUF4166 domain-containing protein [Oceanobacillus limi]SET27315.1 protein of unknown function [Oceanobacillus limi]